ncbi:IS701 family transposase, partial [Streptomyces chartreusis]
GWADFQVRSDTAIRRHQALVNCAFSFCWNTWFAPPPPHQAAPLSGPDALPDPLERGRTDIPAAPTGLLATSAAGRPWLADALGHAATLLAGMVDEAPARSTPGTDRHRRQRQTS